jgi:hypothetical protein
VGIREKLVLHWQNNMKSNPRGDNCNNSLIGIIQEQIVFLKEKRRYKNGFSEFKIYLFMRNKWRDKLKRRYVIFFQGQLGLNPNCTSAFVDQKDRLKQPSKSPLKPFFIRLWLQQTLLILHLAVKVPLCLTTALSMPYVSFQELRIFPTQLG